MSNERVPAGRQVVDSAAEVCQLTYRRVGRSPSQRYPPAVVGGPQRLRKACVGSAGRLSARRSLCADKDDSGRGFNQQSSWHLSRGKQRICTCSHARQRAQARREQIASCKDGNEEASVNIYSWSCGRVYRTVSMVSSCPHGAHCRAAPTVDAGTANSNARRTRVPTPRSDDGLERSQRSTRRLCET